MGIEMKSYFRLKKRREKFIKIVESWIGTPYHHMWHTKGRGADCSLFIAECLKEQGILKEVIVKDYYPTDWQLNGQHLLEHTIENVKLEKELQIIELKSNNNLMFGDIMVFTFVSTGIPHHSAIYTGDNIIVQVGKGGVTKTLYDNRWQKHLVSVYRIVE